jgi:hypothetical protein
MVNRLEVYRSYLLRIWRAGSADAPSWRLLIEDVLSRERYGFTSPEELAAFLQARTSTPGMPEQPQQDIDQNLEQ